MNVFGEPWVPQWTKILRTQELPKVRKVDTVRLKWVMLPCKRQRDLPQLAGRKAGWLDRWLAGRMAGWLSGRPVVESEVCGDGGLRMRGWRLKE